MRVFALIPVKRLGEAKKRLSAVLDTEERRGFILAMLKDVLKTVYSSNVDIVVTIASDSAVQDLCSNCGGIFLPDAGEELNGVLEDATNWCVSKGAESVLVLPADVPLVTYADIDELISLCTDRPSVAIAPSRDGGTNALMRNPPDVIPTHFGDQSFKKHVNEALKMKVPAQIYRSMGLSLDIDSPQDLKRFTEFGEGTEAHSFLKQRGIYERLESLFPKRSRRFNS